MHDEWRLSLEAVSGAEGLEEDLRKRCPESVEVSRDGDDVFVYGESRAAVEALVPPALRTLGRIHRWHPVDGWVAPGEWVEPEVEPPREWEVEISLQHAWDAIKLGDELRAARQRGWHHGKRIAVHDLTRAEADRLANDVRRRFSVSTTADVRRYEPPEDGLAPGATFGRVG